ncbi:hypothetical protein BaRGS_00031265 [Batillaria attramentaria]|uniref:Uncharacterized protein n=1 Tax=Batillaria attramentaria TaxID=370345 RepID=A0ABD0JQY5_9CAEN
MLHVQTPRHTDVGFIHCVSPVAAFCVCLADQEEKDYDVSSFDSAYGVAERVSVVKCLAGEGIGSAEIIGSYNHRRMYAQVLKCIYTYAVNCALGYFVHL